MPQAPKQQSSNIQNMKELVIMWMAQLNQNINFPTGSKPRYITFHCCSTSYSLWLTTEKEETAMPAKHIKLR